MVASDIPCLRARSAVFTPASCSFNTAIICSSVNLARFICPSFFGPDSNFFWRKYSVAGHHPQPLLGTLAVDAPLDVEQRIDALDRLECDRGDRRRVPRRALAAISASSK